MKWKQVLYFTFLFLLLCFSKTAAAEERNTVKICLKDLGTSMENVCFEAYKVGVLQEGFPEIEERFQMPVFPDKAYQLDYAAKKISQMISEHAEISGVTDKFGFLIFDGLKSGVYLIRETGRNSYGIISPFLVSLPYSEDGTAKSFLTVEPKASLPDLSPTSVPKAAASLPVPQKKDNPLAASVKTGDFTEARSYLIMAGMAFLTGTVLLLKLLKKKEEAL